jgi:hypothetical protein
VQEVGVQRVHPSLRVDRASARDQRLPGDLPAEHALHRRVGGEPAEQRVLEALDVEQLEQHVERLILRRHLEIVAARHLRRPAWG